MKPETTLQFSKLWSTIKSMKKEIKELNNKIDNLLGQKIEYDINDDFYDEDVVRRYLKPTDLKNEEPRYIDL